MPKFKSKAARTKDGAVELAMVARHRGAEEQELVVSLGFLSLILSFSFPSSPFLSFLFLQECSVNFFFDESDSAIKEKMNTSSTTQ